MLVPRHTAFFVPGDCQETIMRRRSSLQALLTFLLLAPIVLLVGCGVTIPKAAPTIFVTLANPNPPVNSGAQGVSVEVISGAPGPEPTGTLTYQVTDPSSQIASGPVNLPAGSFSLDIGQSGSYLIQLQYSGDKTYNAATATYTLYVQPASSGSSGAVKLYKRAPLVR